MVGRKRELPAPGSAHLELAPGVRHLHPEDDMVRAMLSGWAKQQLGGRLCAENTVKVRASCVGEFIEFSGAYPWEWTARMMDEWSAHLVGSLSRAKSTIRQKQGAVRLFCSFITSPYYDWPTQCELWFGDHPTQICHEWNTSAHLVDYEGDPVVGRSPARSFRISLIAPTRRSRRLAGRGVRARWPPIGTRRCSR